MSKRIHLSTEAAYVLGLVILSLSTAIMEKADLGMSMVVAPAYVLHRWLSPNLPFVTFGVAEYLLQGCLLLLTGLLTRRFRLPYLFSFVTAVLYGLCLDGWMLVVGLIPTGFTGLLPVRILFYLIGMVFCAMSVALLFRTYISPEAYELTVKELSATKNWEIHKVKTVYDCISCAVALVMSFAAFGFGTFVGIKWGTIFCALVNGWLISRWDKLFDNRFTFTDRLPELKKWFT